MTDFEYALILKATWYYYMENYTQQQISQVMGVSRAKVIRLLDEARERGIIQFIFRQEDTQRMKIEQELISKFDLDDAFVVPTSNTPEGRMDSVARAAAMYLSDRLRPDGFLNVGYGDTMGILLSYLASTRKTALNAVSLTGGVGFYLPKMASGVSTMKLFLIPTPLVVSSLSLREALLSEPSVQDIYRMTEFADMTVIGIGATDDNATVLRNSILSKNDLALLKMQGAVGDILDHFFDANGQPVDSTIEGRIISTGLDQLREMKNVVGVATGPQKVAAILASLRSKFLNVLVTDEETAAELLAAEEEM